MTTTKQGQKAGRQTTNVEHEIDSGDERLSMVEANRWMLIVFQ